MANSVREEIKEAIKEANILELGRSSPSEANAVHTAANLCGVPTAWVEDVLEEIGQRFKPDFKD